MEITIQIREKHKIESNYRSSSTSSLPHASNARVHFTNFDVTIEVFADRSFIFMPSKFVSHIKNIFGIGIRDWSFEKMKKSNKIVYVVGEFFNRARGVVRWCQCWLVTSVVVSMEFRGAQVLVQQKPKREKFSQFLQFEFDEFESNQFTFQILKNRDRSQDIEQGKARAVMEERG